VPAVPRLLPLFVEVSTIRKKRGLLAGICKEVVDILKDKRVPPRCFAALRKMKPIRQMQAAELMVASNAYTGAFAAALLAGSKDEMLLEVPKNGRRAEMLPLNGQDLLPRQNLSSNT
jgi:hypothetical protein